MEPASGKLEKKYIFFSILPRQNNHVPWQSLFYNTAKMKCSVGENTILFRLSRFGRFLQGPVVRTWLSHPHSMVKIQPFSQVFLSAGPMPEAFYWSFLWNFKKTSASPYDRDFSKNEKRGTNFRWFPWGHSLWSAGRDERIWTFDPLNPIQVRSQTALHPGTQMEIPFSCPAVNNFLREV